MSLFNYFSICETYCTLSDKGEYTFECVYDLSYAPHDNMWLVFYGVDKEVWVGIESTI